jgi:hypothetical protein
VPRRFSAGLADAPSANPAQKQRDSKNEKNGGRAGANPFLQSVNLNENSEKMGKRFNDDSRHFNKSTRLRADDSKTLFAELSFVGMVIEEYPDPASTREFENSEQLLPRPAGNARIGVAPIQKDGLLQTVEVCRAIGAALQMVPDLPVG